MSTCRIERDKPFVWKNDEGWNCDQTGHCVTCGDVWLNNLAEEVPWAEAIRAAEKAIPTGIAFISDPRHS